MGLRQMLKIHPQQHSSGWDHNQGSPSPNSLVKQLAKNSGINDTLTNWLKQWFGKWKGVMTSILISLIDVFGLKLFRVRGLTVRLTETTLNKLLCPVSS
jgi:hypothetical protein